MSLDARLRSPSVNVTEPQQVRPFSFNSARTSLVLNWSGSPEISSASTPVCFMRSIVRLMDSGRIQLWVAINCDMVRLLWSAPTQPVAGQRVEKMKFVLHERELHTLIDVDVRVGRDRRAQHVAAHLDDRDDLDAVMFRAVDRAADAAFGDKLHVLGPYADTHPSVVRDRQGVQPRPRGRFQLQ